MDEPVFVVHADDDDRGDNAELIYILETATQLLFGQIFRLHRTTGEVYVYIVHQKKTRQSVFDCNFG